MLSPSFGSWDTSWFSRRPVNLEVFLSPWSGSSRVQGAEFPRKDDSLMAEVIFIFYFMAEWDRISEYRFQTSNPTCRLERRGFTDLGVDQVGRRFSSKNMRSLIIMACLAESYLERLGNCKSILIIKTCQGYALYRKPKILIRKHLR